MMMMMMMIMSPRNGTVVPGRQTSPVGGLRDQNLFAFGIDVIAVCPSYTAVRRPLAIELSRSLPLVPGMISHAMSRPHHLCQFSAVAWRRISSGVPSRDFCSACEVTLSLLDTLIVLVTYLLTHQDASSAVDIVSSFDGVFCSRVIWYKIQWPWCELHMPRI